MKKKVTMTIDEDVFAKFQEYCQSNGMKVSSKVEVLMKTNLARDIAHTSR